MDIFAGDIEIDLPPDDDDDPHVRVVGAPEAVRAAGAMVRQELEPHNKVTMKLDVSWTHHSHIIGKGGNTIQPVVKRTGVSIHFPDGNKNSEIKKSNQVSINSRGEELSGLEEARGCIRELTPLVFSFSLCASAQFINISDPSMLIQHVQTTYNVQADLKVTDDITPMIIGSVRGNEWDAVRVKEATLCILQAYCDSLANQMPVQMTVEISPQHHSFVLGRNNETLKRIMQRTATKITFPDSGDTNMPPLKKSTVVITGAIDNVYLARQNLVGALPLVLMFELMPDQNVDANEVSQVMHTLDVNIIIKNKKLDGRRLVVIKGAEKNAGNIYEAWRLISRADRDPPKANIPPNYHIPEAAPLYGLSMSLADLNIGHWLGGSSGGSPTGSPAPQMHSTSHWGGAPQPPTPTSHVPSYLPRSHYNSLVLDPASLSVMMTDIERRAPGCEKKRMELEHQKLTSLSDYNSKKLQAAKAMKEQVNAGPRTPTSSWSGYGFSKSMPGFMIRQKRQQERLQKSHHKGEMEKWDNWQSTEDEASDFSQAISNIQYPPHLSQMSVNLGSSDGMNLQRPPVNLSASNYIDSFMSRPCKSTGSSSQMDITKILTDIQLEQYIDVFAAQEVDLDMFLTLDDSDLKELGIKIFGHRKRILMVIKDLANKKPFYAGNLTSTVDHHSATLRDGTSAWD